MNIFFDMDYTIIEVDDGRLRPGVEALLRSLRLEGHSIYIWSGLGNREEEIRLLGLQDMVDGIFEKPTTNYDNVIADKVARRKIPCPPDLVVDDCSEIVAALGGILVPPYGVKVHNDQEMRRVHRIIRECVSTGHSWDPAYRPKPARERSGATRALEPAHATRSGLEAAREQREAP